MIVESIRIALRALSANKLRSALTMLGIIIGVGAVIALMALGRGLEFYVSQQFQNIGTNLLFVFPSQPSGDGSGAPQRMSTGMMTNGDVEALRDPLRVPDVTAVTAEVQSGAKISAGRVSEYMQV